MELEFSRQIFEIYSDVKFHEIHPAGAEVFYADGQTNKYDIANSRFSKFCEFA